MVVVEYIAMVLFSKVIPTAIPTIEDNKNNPIKDFR